MGLFGSGIKIKRCTFGALLILFFCGMAGQAEARIGDSKAEAEARFKAHEPVYMKDKYGFKYATYSTPGFSIKQYYLNDVCVKSTYYKKNIPGGSREFLMPEIQKIAEIETYGKWNVVLSPGSPESADSSLYAAFKNDEGTTLEINGTKRMITVETQAYRDVVEKFGQ